MVPIDIVNQNESKFPIIFSQAIIEHKRSPRNFIRINIQGLDPPTHKSVVMWLVLTITIIVRLCILSEDGSRTLVALLMPIHDNCSGSI